MKIDLMKQKLEKAIPHKRYVHSLNVMETAVQLAEIYGEDVKKAAVAGLLHDCAKDIDWNEALNMARRYEMPLDGIMEAQPSLIHGPLGAIISGREYDVEDKDILEAIRFHTTGKTDMSLLEKIIYIADFVEPLRNYPESAEARKVVRQDLDGALIISMNATIVYVMKKNGLIHPNTIEARNFLIAARKMQGNLDRIGSVL